MPSQRQQRLDTIMAHLQVQYGPRALHMAGEAARSPAFPHISTTFPALDQALGIGGLPRGRISEISGPPSSGKATLAAKTLAAAHREREALAAWLDLSSTCDPDYLYRCGIDLNRLLVVRPHGALDALAILLHLVESNTLAALVFDSLVDLAPEHEPQLAGTLERLTLLIDRTATAVLFLSEPQSSYRTLAHLATVRLEIVRQRWVLRGADIWGYEGTVQIVKHKLGQAGAQVPMRITFDSTVRGDGA